MHREILTEEAALRIRLAFNVRSLRIAARLTEQSAAQRAGIHVRHWQRIEAGQVSSTLSTLERLAEALDVNPAELLRECSIAGPESTLSQASASSSGGDDRRTKARRAHQGAAGRRGEGVD